MLDFERQGGISGWRHVRKAAGGIKEDNPVAFFYAQDVRYIAKEHMDVRRDCFRYAQHPMNGISRRSTWMCGAIVSDTHNTPKTVYRDHLGK